MLAVEIGRSSNKAPAFENDGSFRIVPLAEHRSDEWIYAAPGLVDGDRLRRAHHLH